MATDLINTPTTGTQVQACGDCHLMILMKPCLLPGKAIARFAEAYADQNDRDHARLEEAAKAGEIVIQQG